MPKPYLGEAPPGVLRVAVAVTAILLAATAGAQVCTVDAEPNDTPATAQDVSDTLCIAGSMAAQDQDAYLWVVDDEAAARWWSVSMEGIPGHLTKVDLIRVTLADNGVDVTAADTLASFTSPGGALTESAPVLVAPGRYVLGVSKSGGEGAYVVHLDPGDALRRGRRGVDGLDGVDGAFAIFGMANGEVALPWRLAADDASLRWDLELVAAVGSDARLALRGADGAEVAASGTGELGRATLRSLGVGAGEVAVSVTGLPSGAPFTLSATSAGRVTDGNEVEPNNGWDEANVLSLGRAMHGSGPDKDYFVLDVPDAARGKTYDLSLESDANAYLSLFSADHEEIQTRHGASGAMRGLVLDAPRYGVTVGVGGDASYTLVFSEASPPEDGHESEPNDVLAVADPLSDGLTVRGGLEVQDKDVYRFTTTGPAQLWRIQAVGSGVRSLTTYDAGGARQASLQGERRIRLDNVALLPGEHFIEVGGNAGAYALRALALGPVPDEKPAPPSAEDAGAQQLPLKAAAPPPQAEPEAIEPSGPPPPPGVIELEPNDDDSRAELLRVGQTRVGVLTGTNDVDAYRFYLASDQYVRIEAVPPEDGSLFFDVREAGVRAQSQGPGSPVVFQRRLLAGNYDLWLRADTASDGYYQLRMSQLDPLTLPDDVEPNDSPATANRLPADLDVEGKVGDITGPDFYALPAFDAPTTLHVDGTLGEDTRIALLGDGAPRLVRNNDGSFDADLPAGAHLFLRMNGRGDYRFVARFGSAPDASELRPPNGDPGASLALERSARDVAAYWYEGQALDDELTIENTSDRKQTYALEVATSSVAVTPHVPATVTVGPGQRASVPLSVTVAPDARDDQPVRVTVGARSDAGIATTSLTLVPRCEAAPVAPKASWAVPDAMLGRLDVAWSGLGATIVDDAGRDAQTVDALTSPATGAHHEVGEAITVDLAGDEPITLAGALLQPQGGPDVRRQLRDFSIQVSLDGETFETVLESSLRAARVEQAFAFPKAVEARYARLVFGPDQAGNSGAWIGEWKLVAAADDPLGELNLADPALGGHVLWSDPLIPESQRHSMILDEQADRPRVDGHGNPRATWVVGFRDDRAAQFTRLEWVESSDSTSEGAFSDVAVDVSLSSPVGPWEHLADWHLERDAAGTAALALPEPSWARFVRFTATGPEQGVRSMFPPDTLRILERPSGDGYRSAVGEWGQYRKEAVYEWQQGGADGAATGQTGPDAADSDSRDAPRPLASGDVVEGTVAVAEDEDWFTITVPDGQNHLSLRLEGDPTLAYNYALTSAAGDAVAYDERHDGDAVVLDALRRPRGVHVAPRGAQALRHLRVGHERQRGTVHPHHLCVAGALHARDRSRPRVRAAAGLQRARPDLVAAVLERRSGAGAAGDQHLRPRQRRIEQLGERAADRERRAGPARRYARRTADHRRRVARLRSDAEAVAQPRGLARTRVHVRDQHRRLGLLPGPHAVLGRREPRVLRLRPQRRGLRRRLRARELPAAAPQALPRRGHDERRGPARARLDPGGAGGGRRAAGGRGDLRRLGLDGQEAARWYIAHRRRPRGAEGLRDERAARGHTLRVARVRPHQALVVRHPARGAAGAARPRRRDQGDRCHPAEAAVADAVGGLDRGGGGGSRTGAAADVSCS